MPGDRSGFDSPDPCDAQYIETGGLFPLLFDVNAIPGEYEAVKVHSDLVPATTPMPQAANIVLMGCSVVEGEGIGIVIATGTDTQLSKIAEKVTDHVNSARGIISHVHVTVELHHIILTHFNREITYGGVFIARLPDRVRVAVCNDTMTLRQSYGQWLYKPEAPLL